jgi:hypothetical protein
METELDTLLYTLPSAETCRMLTEHSKTFWSPESNFSPTIKDVKRILKNFILNACKEKKSFIEIKIGVNFYKEIAECLKQNGFEVAKTRDDTIGSVRAYMVVVSWHSDDIPEDPKPEDPKSEDPKPGDPKPGDPKPENAIISGSTEP